MKCEKCKFWESALDDPKGNPWMGECRRYPPTQKQDGEIYKSVNGVLYMRVSQFEIITYHNSYCGEYEVRIPQ